MQRGRIFRPQSPANKSAVLFFMPECKKLLLECAKFSSGVDDGDGMKCTDDLTMHQTELKKRETEKLFRRETSSSNIFRNEEMEAMGYNKYGISSKTVL